MLRRPGAAGVVVDGHDAARGVVEAEGAIEARPEADLEEDAHPPPRARLAGQGDRHHPGPERLLHGPHPGAVQLRPARRPAVRQRDGALPGDAERLGPQL